MPQVTATDHLLAAGHLLGPRYRIERHIGSGAMGQVYAARELGSSKAVAIKVISEEHTTDATMVARFRREGRVMAETRHPNIVEVVDLDVAEGRWFLAMELLDGINLAQAIAQKPRFEPEEIVPVLRAVLDALGAAHGREIVHRDLKPENIFLVGPPNGAFQVKVLDFGVARVVDESAEEQLTRSGTIIGTPEFMSPEQAMGRKADARSDLYAVGCIAYTMLCGRPPFLDNWPMRVIMKQAFEPHVPPSRVRTDLSAGGGDVIDRFVARALAKKPEERFQSAAEMREALDSLAQ